MYKQLKLFISKFKEFLSQKFKKYDGKIPYIITVVVTLLVVVLGIKFFLKLTRNLHTDLLSDFDAVVSEYVTSFRTDALTTYFKFVTDVGDALGYLIVFSVCSFLFYLFFKNWKYVLQLSSILVLALSSNLILKEIINRERPTLEHLVTVKTLSYPSGHAMTAMAFYGFLIYLILTFKISKLLKFALVTVLLLLILSIGVSRIYLGVHFPSDIVGGFVAGFIWVVFCILILNIFKVFKEDPNT
ncbi:phosphatase PAP2 family protein [Polaribacter sp. MED152]|uniref:phosphatase PAP2 family protein n=1 Tax=Polaribacter sp. MED152 TaxID=313598 RepID=UPI000068C907|nr:phosphatase PAP2 family protein [Polaribacter sp. MED152]EAQ42250.1 PAP2 superfamily protein [Polaribacter sp. MED152]